MGSGAVGSWGTPYDLFHPRQSLLMLSDFPVQLQFVVLEREEAAQERQEIHFADRVSCLRRLEGEPGLRKNGIREEGDELSARWACTTLS